MVSLRFADAPFETFEVVCKRTIACMKRYGDRRGFRHYQEYTVLEDHHGGSQVLLSIYDLRVLSPTIVDRLHRLIKPFPRWEIVVVITVDDHLEDWPNMGLYIRGHEIIDGLQREYFPPEFRGLKFEGAIPGGEND